MLLSVFLQVTVTKSVATTVGVSAAVYATLVVGVLSLIASGLNTFYTSRTAQRVTKLSIKTTRDMGDLSAKVTREAAALAAQTAHEVKDQEYKHDFYKRIIARRFAAWEELEHFMAGITIVFRDAKDGKSFLRHCCNGKMFDETVDRMRPIVVKQVFWMGKEYANEFKNLYNLNLTIRREAIIPDDRDEIPAVDDKLLIQAGKKYHQECALLINKLLRIQGEQIGPLHEVEKFLNNVEYVGVAVGS